jgi:tetratricopeptide (TPR) repeat protein
MDAAEDKAAFGVLKRAPQESWGPEDFALSLRLCDRLDDFKEAADIFADMQDSVAVKDGPDLYYRYALICEKEGRIDLSQGIYEKIRKRFPDFRDVPARLEKLAAIPSSEAKPIASRFSEDAAVAGLSCRGPGALTIH